MKSADENDSSVLDTRHHGIALCVVAVCQLCAGWVVAAEGIEYIPASLVELSGAVLLAFGL